MRKIVLAVTALLLVALDQLSKFFVVKYIRLGTIVEFIPNLVSLTYLRNTGAAFSILENQQWLFTVITFIVLGVAFYYLIKQMQTQNFWLLASLLQTQGF